ncbi:hypothetical protein CDV55_100904 [Aspergillus turcosus]|nr:hypothetical protein CDV55_100904 [Aspergillus turcosus]
MAAFRKAFTAPPSPCPQIMTPPGSPPLELSLRSTDKDDLKQLFVDAIQQVLSEIPVVSASSREKSQPTTASLLADLLKVFQATPKSASVGVEKDNHLQLPWDSRGVTPPNSPCITPSEPAAIFQLQEYAGLVHAPDDQRAYSVYAEKPRATASDCGVSENRKSAVTINDDATATPQNHGPASGGHLMPSTVDTAATDGQRLAPGVRVSNVKDRRSRGICDIYTCSSTPFGPLPPQLNADELEKLLANAGDMRGQVDQADTSNTADALGSCEAREIEFEDLRGDRQDIPYPEDSHVPSEPVTMDQLKDLFQAVLDCKPQTASNDAENGPAGREKKAENNQDSDDKRILASRMEYKTVNEAWDSKAYKYKIVDSPPPQDVSELDEFVFVVRKRIQKQTHDAIIYVDIKSPVL